MHKYRFQLYQNREILMEITDPENKEQSTIKDLLNNIKADILKPENRMFKNRLPFSPDHPNVYMQIREPNIPWTIKKGNEVIKYADLNFSKSCHFFLDFQKKPDLVASYLKAVGFKGNEDELLTAFKNFPESVQEKINMEIENLITEHLRFRGVQGTSNELINHYEQLTVKKQSKIINNFPELMKKARTDVSAELPNEYCITSSLAPGAC